MDEKYREEPVASDGSYAAVWAALLVLLALTVAVARLNLLAQFSVLGALVIASIKAGLVLAFFMHLRGEGRFLKGMLLITVSALALLIGLTFADVWWR